MARIKNGMVLSGKAVRMIFSEWKGIPVMRAALVRSKNSWSEKQVLHRQRFKAINGF